MKNNILYLLLLVVQAFSFAQDRQRIAGKVQVDNFGIKDVLVVNVNAQVEIRTDSLGDFTLMAQVGDLLVLSDYKIVEKKIRYTPDLVKNNVVVLNVQIEAIELEGVTIDKYAHINSVALGIVPKNQKRYTVAERRLYTAGGGDFSIGLLALTLDLDGMINKISGRTKMLKQNLDIERSEMLLEKINNILTERELIEEFKIPQDHIKGFLYYAADNKYFSAAVAAKKTELAKFMLAGIAKQYLDLQNEKE